MTTTPDPRPTVTRSAEGWLVVGARCTACRHPLLWRPNVCPLCGGALTAAGFGPAGTVWSSTVVRVPVPNRTPPYALAYVDLDDGPRVLAHVRGALERPAVGARVVVVAAGEHGDLTVEVMA